MLNCRANALINVPLLCVSLMLVRCSKVVLAGRPNVFPSALARSRTVWVRSTSRSHSVYATVANIVSIS